MDRKIGSLAILLLISAAYCKDGTICTDCECSLGNFGQIVRCTEPSVTLETLKERIPPTFTIAELHMNYMAIQAVPVATFGKKVFQNLRILDLSWNNITKLDPKVFSSLRMLTDLILSENQLTTLEVGTLENLNNLVRFNISNNNLQNVMFFKDLASKTKLKVVDLSYNHIHTLSGQTFRSFSAVNLTILLRHAGLKDIDARAFSGFDSIETLDISENLIEDYLPDALCGIGEYSVESLVMRKLNLNDTELTREFWLCMQASNGIVPVKSLDLSNNILTVLSVNTLMGLDDLEILHLSNTSLKEISPDALDIKPKLKHLDLSNNRELVKIPHFVNSATDLPYNPQLLVLNMSRTGIVDIHEEFTFDGLQNIVELDLSHTHIHTLVSSNFYRLQNLQKLHMHHTPLRTLDSGSFASPTITFLDLAYNGMDMRDHEIFHFTAHLQVLNVSGNYLNHANMTHIFEHSYELKELIMDNCSLSHISDPTFDHLSELKILSMNRNKLDELEPEWFMYIQGLQTLSVNHNKIEYVKYEEIGAQRPYLKKIDFSYNPFICKCKNKWFAKWLRNDNVSEPVFQNTDDVEAYVCYPEKNVTLSEYNPSEETCFLEGAALVVAVGAVGGAAGAATMAGVKYGHAAKGLIRKPPLPGSAAKGLLKKPPTGAAKNLIKKPPTGAAKGLMKKPPTGAAKNLVKKPPTGAAESLAKKPPTSAAKSVKKAPVKDVMKSSPPSKPDLSSLKPKEPPKLKSKSKPNVPVDNSVQGKFKNMWGNMTGSMSKDVDGSLGVMSEELEALKYEGIALAGESAMALKDVGITGLKGIKKAGAGQVTSLKKTGKLDLAAIKQAGKDVAADTSKGLKDVAAKQSDKAMTVGSKGLDRMKTKGLSEADKLKSSGLKQVEMAQKTGMNELNNLQKQGMDQLNTLQKQGMNQVNQLQAQGLAELGKAQAMGMQQVGNLQQQGLGQLSGFGRNRNLPAARQGLQGNLGQIASSAGAYTSLLPTTRQAGSAQGIQGLQQQRQSGAGQAPGPNPPTGFFGLDLTGGLNQFQNQLTGMANNVTSQLEDAAKQGQQQLSHAQSQAMGQIGQLQNQALGQMDQLQKTGRQQMGALEAEVAGQIPQHGGTTQQGAPQAQPALGFLGFDFSGGLGQLQNQLTGMAQNVTDQLEDAAKQGQAQLENVQKQAMGQVEELQKHGQEQLGQLQKDALEQLNQLQKQGQEQLSNLQSDAMQQIGGLQKMGQDQLSGMQAGAIGQLGDLQRMGQQQLGAVRGHVDELQGQLNGIQSGGTMASFRPRSAAASPTASIISTPSLRRQRTEPSPQVSKAKEAALKKAKSLNQIPGVSDIKSLGIDPKALNLGQLAKMGVDKGYLDKIQGEIARSPRLADLRERGISPESLSMEQLSNLGLDPDNIARRTGKAERPSVLEKIEEGMVKLPAANQMKSLGMDPNTMTIGQLKKMGLEIPDLTRIEGMDELVEQGIDPDTLTLEQLQELSKQLPTLNEREVEEDEDDLSIIETIQENLDELPGAQKLQAMGVEPADLTLGKLRKMGMDVPDLSEVEGMDDLVEQGIETDDLTVNELINLSKQIPALSAKKPTGPSIIETIEKGIERLPNAEQLVIMGVDANELSLIQLQKMGIEVPDLIHVEGLAEVLDEDTDLNTLTLNQLKELSEDVPALNAKQHISNQKFGPSVLEIIEDGIECLPAAEQLQSTGVDPKDLTLTQLMKMGLEVPDLEELEGMDVLMNQGVDPYSLDLYELQDIADQIPGLTAKTALPESPAQELTGPSILEQIEDAILGMPNLNQLQQMQIAPETLTLDQLRNMGANIPNIMLVDGMDEVVSEGLDPYELNFIQLEELAKQLPDLDAKTEVAEIPNVSEQVGQSVIERLEEGLAKLPATTQIRAMGMDPRTLSMAQLRNMGLDVPDLLHIEGMEGLTDEGVSPYSLNLNELTILAEQLPGLNERRLPQQPLMTSHPPEYSAALMMQQSALTQVSPATQTRPTKSMLEAPLSHDGMVLRTDILPPQPIQTLPAAQAATPPERATSQLQRQEEIPPISYSHSPPSQISPELRTVPVPPTSEQAQASDKPKPPVNKETKSKLREAGIDKSQLKQLKELGLLADIGLDDDDDDDDETDIVSKSPSASTSEDTSSTTGGKVQTSTSPDQPEVGKPQTVPMISGPSADSTSITVGSEIGTIGPQPELIELQVTDTSEDQTSSLEIAGHAIAPTEQEVLHEPTTDVAETDPSNDPDSTSIAISPETDTASQIPEEQLSESSEQSKPEPVRKQLTKQSRLPQAEEVDPEVLEDVVSTPSEEPEPTQ